MNAIMTRFTHSDARAIARSGPFEKRRTTLGVEAVTGAAPVRVRLERACFVLLDEVSQRLRNGFEAFGPDAARHRVRPDDVTPPRERLRGHERLPVVRCQSHNRSCAEVFTIHVVDPFDRFDVRRQLAPRQRFGG